MDKKVGIVAGSFDPITNGHVWLIEQAAQLMDQLYVVIGVNPAKKYRFTASERRSQVKRVLNDECRRLPSLSNTIKIITIENQLLVNYAKDIGANYLIRGIRNTKDFNYEYEMQLVNSKICPTVNTMFFATPRELSEISSSTVKSIVGFDQWEQAISGYVNPIIIDAFREK